MRYKSVILIGLTVLFIGLNWFFPYGRTGHRPIVELFFVVMVMTAFWNLKLLLPLSIIYIVSHTAHDAFVHGTVPAVTWAQSFIHLFAAVVLFRVMKLRKSTSEDKRRLIETMDLGHAHFSGRTDENGEISDIVFLSVNAAFASMFKVEHDPDDMQTFNQTFSDLPKEWFNIFSDVVKHGELREESLYVPSMDKHFRLTFYIPRTGEGAVLVRDITNFKKKSQQIQYINRHDALTGLYNREYLMTILKAHTNEIKGPLGVILFDIDNLEILNRVHSVTAGDDALQLVTETMKKFAHGDHQLFRYGGDEFVLLSKNPDEGDLKSLARKIELDFSSKAVEGISMTLTSGIAVKTEDAKDMEMIMVEAENALYNRKAVQMNSSHIQMLKGLLELLTAKFSYEKVHSERVSRYAQQLGEAMGLSELEIDEARVAAMFHDIGKIAISDSILGKPSKLTAAEFETIKEHSTIGHMILNSTAPNIRISDYVKHHHERYDGLGYPDGLSGGSIPLISRIINVVDAYEAMTSKREYSPPMSKKDAIDEILANKGTQFDPQIADTFINNVLNRKED